MTELAKSTFAAYKTVKYNNNHNNNKKNISSNNSNNNNNLKMEIRVFPKHL